MQPSGTPKAVPGMTATPCSRIRASTSSMGRAGVRTRANPMELVETLIRDHGVAVIPGTAFGVADGCTIRVSYGSLQKDSVVEGIGRLARGLRALV